MNPEMRIDLNQLSPEIRAEIMKAAETVATSTFSPASRSVFSPENLDQEVKVLAPVGTPLRNRISRVPGKGQATAWKRMTSKLHQFHSPVAGAGTGTSIAFADAAAPGETSQTYDVVSAAYKLIGRKVEIGGLAQAASLGGTPMLESREKIKLLEVMVGEEELMILGNAAVTSTEFSGLMKLITTYSGSMGSYLTVSGIGKLCAQQADVEGQYPDLLLASAVQLRALGNQLEGSGSIQRIVVDPQGHGVGGVSLRAIVNPVTGGFIDVAHNRFMGDSALLLTTKDQDTGEAWIQMEDLIPYSRVDVPSTTFSMVRFVLAATVLKLIGEPYQNKIQGLTTTLI